MPVGVDLRLTSCRYSCRDGLLLGDVDVLGSVDA